MDSFLDLIVDFMPWHPIGWDVPLTRRWGSDARMFINTWSEQAQRWVRR